MNEKCEELGLQNTHFMNASGLHNENQYTTPVEMAMILAYAMQNPECAKILSIYQHTTAPLASHPEGILLTSTMFGRMYGTEVPNVTIQAGKTGYTQEAGNCLVSYAEKTGHLISHLPQGQRTDGMSSMMILSCMAIIFRQMNQRHRKQQEHQKQLRHRT